MKTSSEWKNFIGASRIFVNSMMEMNKLWDDLTDQEKDLIMKKYPFGKKKFSKLFEDVMEWWSSII